MLLSWSLAHSQTLASLLTQFPNLRVCVFRLRLFIQSDETGRPDGHWIIMSFIFKCTALSSQWPNQFKRFPKLHPTHRASHPRPQDVQEQSCTVFTSIFKNMLKTLACPHPDDHFFFFFLVWLAGLCPGCRNHIHVLQALPICSPTSLWAAPIMGPVCDRDGWEPRGAHKTCSGREGW